MFSRYRKTNQPAAKPTAPAQAAAHVAPQPAAAAAAAAAGGIARKPLPAQPQNAAVAAAADKENKRKERMGDVSKLHRRLLDNLNLAALEHAAESDLRQEII